MVGAVGCHLGHVNNGMACPSSYVARGTLELCRGANDCYQYCHIISAWICCNTLADFESAWTDQKGIRLFCRWCRHSLCGFLFNEFLLQATGAFLYYLFDSVFSIFPAFFASQTQRTKVRGDISEFVIWLLGFGIVRLLASLGSRRGRVEAGLG